MKTLKTIASTATLVGLLATHGAASAQTSATGQADQHHPQARHSAEPHLQTQQGHASGMMQGQTMQSMMEMMHRMMHEQGMIHGQATSGRGTAAAPPEDESPASLALRAVNEKMHRDMAIALSGNPDVDFAKAMIVHHQGASDMSKVVLAFGQDPDVRRLAEEIIKAQESEIAFLKQWLEKQGE